MADAEGAISGEVEEGNGEDVADESTDPQFLNDEGDDNDDTDEVEGEGEESEEEDEDEEEAESKTKSKASFREAEGKRNLNVEKRIKTLLAENKKLLDEGKEYSNRFAQFERQSQYWQRREAELNSQRAELEKQGALSKRELELIHKQQEMAEEANLDPVEKMQRQTARQALAAAKAEYDPVIEGLRAQIEKVTKTYEQAEQKRAQQGRIDGYRQQTRKAVQGMLSGLDQKTMEGIGPDLETTTFAWAAAHNMEPVDAAKAFDIIAHKYVLAKMKIRGKVNAAKAKSGQEVPKGTVGERKPANGKGKMPSLMEVRKQGFDSHLDWMQANKGRW